MFAAFFSRDGAVILRGLSVAGFRDDVRERVARAVSPAAGATRTHGVAPRSLALALSRESARHVSFFLAQKRQVRANT